MRRIVRLHECDSVESANEMLADARFQLYERIVRNQSLTLILAEWDAAPGGRNLPSEEGHEAPPSVRGDHRNQSPNDQ